MKAKTFYVLVPTSWSNRAVVHCVAVFISQGLERQVAFVLNTAETGAARTSVDGNRAFGDHTQTNTSGMRTRLLRQAIRALTS